MNETTSPDEQWAIEVAHERGEAIDAVERYVYDFHETLKSNAVGFDDDELERLETRDGYLVFTVENLYITQIEIEDDEVIYYVSATRYFAVRYSDPIKGSTEIYKCYREDDGQLVVSWHATP